MDRGEMNHSVFWSDEDGGYIAYLSGSPGISAFGKTENEAIAELKIAEKLFLEVEAENI